MAKRHIKITILGAGISGLAAAYRLDRAGLEVGVLEAGSEPGGSMVSRRTQGFLIDYGANSGLDTTPLIAEMVQELGLSGQMVYADSAGNRRYILRDQKLQALPTNPLAFITTGLFSPWAKLRLLAEPFIGRSRDGYYQSVSQFVERRLGREFLDYAINPFVAGVFAGNPDALSVQSAFPKLYRLEQVYGGLLKGLIKGAAERKRRAETSKQTARMFSFRDGMQAFPRALAERLGKHVHFNCAVEKVTRQPHGFAILYRADGRLQETAADIVVSAIPAYRAGPVFAAMDRELHRHLADIYYPPVKILYLGYRREAIGRPLDGFGFLIPAREAKRFLGAIWSSVIFPDRSKAQQAAFTLFVGGARSPELFRQDPELLDQAVIAEFQQIMKIDAAPIFIREKFWEHAIPQYGIGYIEHERYFEKFEQENPGIFLSGNYRGGIAVGDCIRNSEAVCLKVKALIERLPSG